MKESRLLTLREVTVFREGGVAMLGSLGLCPVNCMPSLVVQVPLNYWHRLGVVVLWL